MADDQAGVVRLIPSRRSSRFGDGGRGLVGPNRAIRHPVSDQTDGPPGFQIIR